MTAEDVFTRNRRLWVRLREKGGSRKSYVPTARCMPSMMSDGKPGVGFTR